MLLPTASGLRPPQPDRPVQCYQIAPDHLPIPYIESPRIDRRIFSVSPQTSIAPPLAPRPWSDRVANAALYLLCLTAFAAPAGAEVATVLLTLAFLSAAPRARLLLREPVVLLALAMSPPG